MEAEPPIWRRLRMRGNRTMGEVHWAIQQSMGWTNSHLHVFRRDRSATVISDPLFEIEDLRVIDEEEVTLEQVLPDVGAAITYEYDFGDAWQHAVVVEAIDVPPSRLGRIECIGGEGACPPEDVGGVHGYADFVAAMRHPNHARHGELAEWYAQRAEELDYPPTFDPARFDQVRANRALKNPDLRFGWKEEAD